MVHNGGSSGARARTPHHMRFHASAHTRGGVAFYMADFPRTLMKGSPDGAVEPARHRQETLDLAA